MSHSRTDRHLDFAQGWECGPVHLENLGEIMLDQPEARVLWIPGEDDNALAGDTPHLREALRAVRPVVNRQNRKYGVKRSTLKRQPACRCLYYLRSRCRALTYHFGRWLDGDHETISGLVGASAGADV